MHDAAASAVSMDDERDDEPDDEFDGEVGSHAGVDPIPGADTPGTPAGRAETAGNGRRAVRAPRAARTWGRFAELWIPEPLRDARVDPGRRGMWILLLVAAVAAVVTAVGVWRDRPEPVPVAAPSLAAMAEPSGVEASSGAGRAAAKATAPSAEVSGAIVDGSSTQADAPGGPIVVSVTGLVGKPGIVTLPGGSRVADAIAAAGGAAAQADVTGMNLAAKLADGDSIVVSDTPAAPAPALSVAPGTAGGSAATGQTLPPGGLIDLNSADEAALDALPGVGPVMAGNIIAWRQANGRFSTVEQLQEITGIGPSRFAQISGLVTVS